MKKTIYDIARLAGVSTATVSKVFNGTGRISEKTRQKVLKISEELNYRPSVVASALTGKKTFTLGLLVPDLANPFFAEIARSVEDRGHELGFNLMICNTDNKPDKELKYVQLLRQKSVDGVIVATGIRNDDIFRELVSQQVPIALVAREMSSLTVDTVLVDDFAGGYQATAHLLERGHRNIAIIAERLSVVSSRERVRGYRAALEEANVSYDPSRVVESDFTVEDGKRVALSLLTSADPPTAIFACNDLLAIGVLQAARELGRAVPDDVSVVGFDNTMLAGITDPPLTTVAQPIREMGRCAVDLITREMNEQDQKKQRVVLNPELVIRKSTARPAQS